MQKGACWYCNKPLHLDRIDFRSVCDHCFQDQHVCVNCTNYCISKPNSCKVLTVDNITDKEKRNFCDEFSVASRKEKNVKNSDRVKKIFGTEVPNKKSFDDLFK